MRKQVKALFGDNKAVSPVIGVILMVAITVILAAVIGTMVMDMTEGVGSTTPTAKIDAIDHNDVYAPDNTNNDTAFRLSHDNGDDIQLKNIRILVKNSDGTTVATFDSSSWVASPSGSAGEVQLNHTGSLVTGSETLTVGQSLTIVQNNDDGTNGDVFAGGVGDEYQIQIVYTEGDSGSSIVDTTATLQ